MSVLTGCPVIPALLYNRETLATALNALLAKRALITGRLEVLMERESDGAARAAAEIIAAIPSLPHFRGPEVPGRRG